MTKEELEKEAGDYADEHAFRVPYDGSNKFYDDVDFKASKEGYLAGAEPREKRIEELEKEKAELIAVERMSLYSQMSDQLAKAKDIIERLLINRPDTYSGTYVELIQSKMFQFNRAVLDADDFLRN